MEKGNTVNLQVVPKFKLAMHLKTAKGGHLLYRDDELGVQLEVHTPRNARSGKWGKGEATYFIDGDDRQFESEVEFMQALATKDKA